MGLLSARDENLLYQKEAITKTKFKVASLNPRVDGSIGCAWITGLGRLWEICLLDLSSTFEPDEKFKAEETELHSEWKPLYERP